MNSTRKIVNREMIGRLRVAMTEKSVVFTNGCFDVIHRGHIECLEKARSLGDVLVVGLNSDDSVRRIKGENRPVNSAWDRARVLSALECVDYVVTFAEDTPERLIHHVRPNILVKGQDWEGLEVAGARFVIDTGGRVVFLPLVPDLSTTRILERCKS